MTIRSVVCAAALLATASTAVLAGEPAPIATLAGASGNIVVVTSAGPQPGVVGMALRDGDRIVAGVNSTARFAYTEGKCLGDYAVRANSAATVSAEFTKVSATDCRLTADISPSRTQEMQQRVGGGPFGIGANPTIVILGSAAIIGATVAIVASNNNNSSSGSTPVSP